MNEYIVRKCRKNVWVASVGKTQTRFQLLPLNSHYEAHTRPVYVTVSHIIYVGILCLRVAFDVPSDVSIISSLVFY